MDTRVLPGTCVKLSKWDADDRDIIGKKKVMRVPAWMNTG